MSYRRHHYECRIEQNEGRYIYIISMLVAKGEYQDIPVSEDVYNEIRQFPSQDRHLSHQDERHSEFSELSDEDIYGRAHVKPRPEADIAVDRLLYKQVLVALKTLSPIQARRFVLRNFLEFTYVEIAKMEGCSARSVKDCVDLATKKIRRILKL